MNIRRYKQAYHEHKAQQEYIVSVRLSYVDINSVSQWFKIIKVYFIIGQYLLRD